ncbi:MAG: amino acid ABC transporter substrate-binding protein [Desulfobulbaceae bacterium]|nr:MAG: amino acid ABC transporter substrate-binding protein [Desulfobulbaceae bacterium]
MRLCPFPRIISALLPLALLCLMLLPNAATGKMDRLVMVTEEWPPFRINDRENPSGFRGIDVDIVEKLAGELGVAIEIQRHPWARALEMMRTGQADMVTGAARTAEREVFMHYIPVSYCAVRPVFYTQRGKGQSIRTYQDLYGRKIGYSLHSAYFEPFNSDTRLDKVGLSTEQQLLQVLALGRLELIIGTDPNISYDTTRMGFTEKIEPTAYAPPDKTELFITLSRKSSAMDLAPQIERALRKLLDDGTIETILERYR